MNCPVCKSQKLAKKALEEKLDSHECDACHGRWIQASSYWKWLNAHGPTLPEKPESETVPLEVAETKEIKICPDCGHFLSKRKVGHGIPFHIDRCATCGGIWLEENEWEILKSRNLHDEIHFIFSTAWQTDILKSEQRKFYEQKTRSLLGDDDYASIKKFKDWVKKHPKQSLIMAYLKNEKI